MSNIKGTTEDDRLLNAYNLGFKEGYDKALDDNNILHGKAAEDFLKNMKENELNSKANKIIDEAMKLVGLSDDKDE